jgi:hypothetical protein
MQPTLESVTERIERLERDNRRLKCFATLLLLGVSAVGLMGQSLQDRITANVVLARTVEAQSLLLRDGAGKVRALLETDPAGPITLTLSDKDGRERLALGVGPAGGVGIIFRDKEAVVRAGIGVGPTGRPYLVPKRLALARGDEKP